MIDSVLSFKPYFKVKQLVQVLFPFI